LQSLAFSLSNNGAPIFTCGTRHQVSVDDAFPPKIERGTPQDGMGLRVSYGRLLTRNIFGHDIFSGNE
jgi:hypothetical protein